MHTNFTE